MLMDQQHQQQQQQQQGFKHYCRICKKGFGCGRALGGHMRAHGINDVDATDDDDPSASGEYCIDDDKPLGPRRMYALRTNPNRLKSCCSCDNCGKEFLSWNSFLDHGKRSSGDDVGTGGCQSPPSSDSGEDLGCAGWSKGKRSRRTKAMAAVTGNASSSEEELANCLVMLSAARVEPAVAAVETEESCASANKEDQDHRLPTAAVAASAFTAERAKAPAGPDVPRGMFECKACKKVFSSHQALGGHRASHKKVKGCFAAKLGDEVHDARGPILPDEEVVATHVNPITDAEMAVAMSMALVPFDNSPLAVAPLKKKNAKVHECSICRRVFTSGQALGGHKRCHWITSNAPDPMASSKLPGSHLTLRPIFDPPSDAGPLDLNLPATPADGLAALRQSDMGSPLRLEVPTVYLQPWIDQSNPNKKNKMAATSGCSNIRHNNSVNPNCSINNNETSVDDEADSKVKLAKLSDLKDFKDGGEASSPWLQVGIGTSPANECACDP